MLPTLLWLPILRRGQAARDWLHFGGVFLLAGVGAMLATEFAAPLLNWLTTQWGWSILLGYALLGVLIEYFKNLAVRVGGWRYCRDIDDVLALSFAAALGFVAFENLFLFLLKYSGDESIVAMIKYTLSRQFFVLPVHLFCSGVFGYFYGVGRFASPEFARTDFARVQRLLFFMPLRSRHRIARIVCGTLISVTVYAIFFTIVKLDPSLGDLVRLFGLWDFAGTPLSALMDESIAIIIFFAFSVVATTLFFLLMDRKRDFVRLKQLVTNDEI